MKFLFLYLLSFSSLANIPQVKFNSNNLTVSGISSGAFFAHQFHMIHNKYVRGAALFAGGPYLCSKGSVNRALKNCMKGEGSFDLADLSLKEAKKKARFSNIDKLKYTKDDRVYIFTGLTDSVVNQSVSFQLKRFYHLAGLRSDNALMIDSLMAGHTYPTTSFGNKCNTPKKSPFISDCNYDGALESLSYLYPEKKNNGFFFSKGKLSKISQKEYFSNSLDSFLMQDEAYLYIPARCLKGRKCDLHVAFHGCAQTVDHIDEIFVKKTGIMQAAAKLDLVVLFPQAKKATNNPHGCWDWWGHSGNGFATKAARQVSIISKLINDLLRVKIL